MLRIASRTRLIRAMRGTPQGTYPSVSITPEPGRHAGVQTLRTRRYTGSDARLREILAELPRVVRKDGLRVVGVDDFYREEPPEAFVVH